LLNAFEILFWEYKLPQLLIVIALSQICTPLIRNRPNRVGAKDHTRTSEDAITVI